MKKFLLPLIQHPFALPLVSGCAMVLAYPPWSVPVLPFLGLVPLFLFFSRPRTFREVSWSVAAFGLPFFLGNLYWLFLLARFTPAGTGAGIGTFLMHMGTFLLFPVGMNFLNLTLRRPFFWAAPILWMATEYARTFADFAFPWVTLGYTLSSHPLLIQHADLVGVSGISFWILWINSLVAFLLLPDFGRKVRALAGLALALLLALPLAYNLHRWKEIENRVAHADTVSVAVVQPNIGQRRKWDLAARDDNLARLNRLIGAADRLSPDLVVGPEASLPMIASSEETRLPESIRTGTCPLLLGMVRGIGKPEGGRYRTHYNSAVLTDGTRRYLGVHNKRFLVPFTESIPFKATLGFLLPFMKKQFGRFVEADTVDVLVLPGKPETPFGALVCYESLFPDLSRRMTNLNAAFLVNITNDAWFGRSVMPYQHLGFSVFRAVENRRAYARSANTGFSAFIDPLGRVTARSELFQEGVLKEDLPLLRLKTWYTRTGDLFRWPVFAGTFLLFFLAFRARGNRQKRQRSRGNG